MIATPVTSCPPEIRQAIDGYKDLLGDYYRAFAAVFCGYMFGVSNFSEIVRFFFFSPSVSSLSRLFGDEALSRKLNRRQRRIIHRCLQRSLKKPSRYLFAIDDTLIQHNGKTIWGTYYWHDHNTGGTTYGHK